MVALLAGGAYIIYHNKQSKQKEVALVTEKVDQINVNVALVKWTDLVDDYRSNGNFEPIQELSFPSEIGGRVTRVLVDEGSHVKVGQTLAVIKKDQIEVDLTQAQNNLQNAIIDNQRYENAFKTGGVTKQQLDHSRLQLKNAQAAVKSQGLRISDTNVRATISGIVNKKYIEPGSVVAPGTPMFDLVNVSRLKLRVMVDESQVAKLKVGQTLPINVSVYPDKSYVGKVKFIAVKADGALNFPVDIEVNNDGSLKAGMYGTAVFSDSENPLDAKPMLTIPMQAFVNGVSSNQVYVAENGTAKLVNVVSGKVIGDQVEIISGLKENQQVITSGQINLVEGAKIKIIK